MSSFDMHLPRSAMALGLLRYRSAKNIYRSPEIRAVPSTPPATRQSIPRARNEARLDGTAR
jgi:hypothetical protein